MSEEFRIIQRRGEVLLHDGYKYHKKKTSKSGAVLWRCSDWSKNKCGGYVTIKDNKTVRRTKHAGSCIRNTEQIEIYLAEQECKNKVTCEEFRPIPTIYNESFDPIISKGYNWVANMPSFKAMKSGLYKLRNKSADVQKYTSSRGEQVEVPNFHLDFVLCDYVNEEENGLERILVFCSKEYRDPKFLSKIKHVVADGTFQSCPPQFAQLYVFHADFGSTQKETNVIPFLYAFMTEKKEKSYDVLLQLIKSQLPTLNPHKFTLDTELAAINAINMNFPTAEVKTCYFHFKKAVHKMGTKLGLTKQKITRSIVLLCGTLPLLPINLVQEGWAYILQERMELLDRSKSNKMQKYMKFWLQNEEFVRRWSVFGERHRTTNVAENWHSQINKKFGRKPTLVHVLNALKKERRPIAKQRRPEDVLKDQWIQESQLKLLNGQISVGHFLEMMK